jgi:hypothetical protein
MPQNSLKASNFSVNSSQTNLASSGSSRSSSEQPAEQLAGLIGKLELERARLQTTLDNIPVGFSPGGARPDDRYFKRAACGLQWTKDQSRICRQIMGWKSELDLLFGILENMSEAVMACAEPARSNS